MPVLGLTDPNPRVVRQWRVVALILLDTPRLGMNRLAVVSAPRAFSRLAPCARVAQLGLTR